MFLAGKDITTVDGKVLLGVRRRDQQAEVCREGAGDGQGDRLVELAWGGLGGEDEERLEQGWIEAGEGGFLGLKTGVLPGPRKI